MWYKRTIPLIIVFLIGLLAFAQEYVPHPLSGEFREEMTTWFRIIGGFAIWQVVRWVLRPDSRGLLQARCGKSPGIPR